MSRHAAQSRQPTHRPAGGANEDGLPTRRNVIPWHDMERKLAERLAAKAAAGELSDVSHSHSREVLRPKAQVPPSVPPPESGVRQSGFLDDDDVESEQDASLTYQVYSVKELTARRARAAAAALALPPVPVTPSRWPEVQRLALDVLRTAWSHRRLPSPRPRMVVFVEPAVAALGAELKAALRELPWKKIGVFAAIGVGSLLALLVAVLMAADLTDDLKPSNTRNNAPVAVAPSPPNAVAIVAPAPLAPEPLPVVDLDDDIEVLPAAAPKARPSFRPGAKRR